MNRYYERVIPLSDLLNDTSEPPTPIIKDGFLLDNSIMLIAAPHKAKKSFLALNFAMAIATGNGFAGFEITEPKSVHVVTGEGGYWGNRDRVRKMCEQIEGYCENAKITFMNTNRFNILDDDDWWDLKRDLLGCEADVLVLDPLIKFHHEDENSASGMTRVFTRLRLLAEEAEVSIILVHHTGKEWGKGPRGSSVITGEYDSCIMMTKGKDHTDLRFDMRHVETPDPVSLVFNPDTFWFERDETTEIPEVLEIIYTYGKPMSKAQLVHELEHEYEIAQSTAYRKVKKAVIDGIIIQTSTGYTISESAYEEWEYVKK